MKKFSRYTEWLVVGIVAAVMSILNILHVILEWLKNPPDRYFIGITHYFADFFLYVSQMRQGAQGSFLYYHRFTNEPVPPTWIYWFNTMLGFLGGRLGLSPFATYHVSLVLLVIACILLFYRFLMFLYPTQRKKRITALIFIVTASPFLQLDPSHQAYWFSPSLAFNRLGGVPHQVFQTIVFVLLIMCFSHRHIGRTPRLVGLAMLTALGASANPIQMFLFVLAATVATGLLFLKKRDIRTVLPLLILLAVSFPVAMLTNKQFDSPVFAVGKLWEAHQWINRSPGIILTSMGPLLLFIPLGITTFLIPFRPVNVLLVSYTALSYLLFFSPVPLLLFTSPARYLAPASYILWPILAAEGICILRKRSMIIVALLIYTLLTVPSFTRELRMRITAATNPGVLMDTEYNHVPLPVIEALNWLDRQPTDPNRPVVLVDSMKRIEILVPVFTNKTVFTGHPVHTLYPEIKEQLRQDFFNGTMDGEKQKQFLSDHRIGYIITTPTGMVPSLNKVFSSDAIVIYKL